MNYKNPVTLPALSWLSRTHCQPDTLARPDRCKTMRLHLHEFIRRFLLHVLPKGLHRVRHYGCLPQPPYESENKADSSCLSLTIFDLRQSALESIGQSVGERRR